MCNVNGWKGRRHEPQKFRDNWATLGEKVQTWAYISGWRWFMEGVAWVFAGWRDWEIKAPRIAHTHTHRFSGKCPTHLTTTHTKKTGKKLTTAGVSNRQTPPEIVTLGYTCRPLNGYETTMNFLTIKTLAALSSCVITSGAPTAAIIVPLQWRAMRSALWDYSAAGTRQGSTHQLLQRETSGLCNPRQEDMFYSSVSLKSWFL